MPGNERSKAPIRRNDEPANRRRPHFRRERRRAASRPVPAARVRLEKPSASNFPASNHSAANLPASNHPVSNRPTPNLRQGGRCRAASAARRLFGGTTSQQTFSSPQRRRECRRAASCPVPAARVRLEKPSASNLPASNYPASNFPASNLSASNHPVTTSSSASNQPPLLFYTPCSLAYRSARSFISTNCGFTR